MNTLRQLNLGRYEPRDTLLHRLDPRCKLLVLPPSVMAVFAADNWTQLAALAGWTLLLLALSRIALGVHLRGLRFLRWLFLFTLLLHTLLSPGRTLFGQAWLSLDGLIYGGQMVCRLALAVLLSSLLTLTTSPAMLAHGIERLVRPFHLLGLRGSGGLLVWVLHFVPILREEALALAGAPDAPPRGRGLIGRAQQVRSLVAPLLVRLVVRADDLAHRLAAGETILDAEETRDTRWRGCDTLVLVLTTLVLAAILWGL